MRILKKMLKILAVKRQQQFLLLPGTVICGMANELICASTQSGMRVKKIIGEELLWRPKKNEMVGGPRTSLVLK